MVRSIQNIFTLFNINKNTSIEYSKVLYLFLKNISRRVENVHFSKKIVIVHTLIVLFLVITWIFTGIC